MDETKHVRCHYPEIEITNDDLVRMENVVHKSRMYGMGDRLVFKNQMQMLRTIVLEKGMNEDDAEQMYTQLIECNGDEPCLKKIIKEWIG